MSGTEQPPDAAETARRAAEGLRFNPLVHENATLVDQKLFIERMTKIMGLDLRDWRSADSATRGLLFDRDAAVSDNDRLRAENARWQDINNRAVTTLREYESRAVEAGRKLDQLMALVKSKLPNPP